MGEQENLTEPQSVESAEQEQPQATEQDYDDGFDLSRQSDEGSGSEEESAPLEEKSDVADTVQADTQPQEQQPQFQQSSQPQQYQQQQQYFQNAQTGTPQAAQQYQQPQQSQQRSPQVKFVKINDDIKAEFDELQKLSPQAAYLAQTDTPIGKRLRSRLETYGADLAQEAAENYMIKQDFSKRLEEERVTRLRAEQEREAAYFHNTFMKRQPEYRKLWIAAQTDPQKEREFNRVKADLQSWIESKPLKEGAALMQIALNGRDPNQVCDLLDLYYKERGNKRKSLRDDPTGAYAVPSRGISSPQPGIGDQDSFDAGWAINNREERRR